MSRFDKLVTDQFERAQSEGRLNPRNAREVSSFYTWIRERFDRSYNARSDYDDIRAELEDAIDFHRASLSFDSGFKDESNHFTRRAMHSVKRGVDKADRAYEGVWDFGSKVFKLGILGISSIAVILVGFWFFWSNEAALPKVQRAALENTACRPLAKDQCDYLISAIERTKSSFAITAANAGNLKPAEEAIQANARTIEADPKASAQSKEQAAADVAVLGIALSRIETQTKRVGDILEDSARRDRTIKEEVERKDRAAQEAELNKARQRITTGGYTLDGKGYFEAMAEDLMYTLEYKKLNIVPTEADLNYVISKLKGQPRQQLFGYLAATSYEYPYARSLIAKMKAEQERLLKDYPKNGALDGKAKACDPKVYAFPIDRARLADICRKKDLREFLTDYGKFMQEIY